jgi:hypothetical protein
MALRAALGRGAMVGALLLLAACGTRSISNSGYEGRGNPMYRGELSEYDVLGVDRTGGFSEADIQKAMVQKQPIAVRKGSAILLVQSGAELADPEMISALEKYYTVASFSGVPLNAGPAAVPYS